MREFEGKTFRTQKTEKRFGEDKVLAEDIWDDLVKETRPEKPLQDKKVIYKILRFIATNRANTIIWVILICFVLNFLVDFHNDTNDTKNDCDSHLQMLKNKYNNQDPLFWRTISYGIKGVKENSRPSVITFLYNDKKSLEIFEAAVELTKMCISLSEEPIVLSSKELNVNNAQKDYGIIFEKYKSELLRSQIMLVQDLQMISALSSRVFHDFCDMKNPIVIYFTLYYTKKDQQSYRNAEELAGSLLKKIWSFELDDNIASPLITRVTEETLFLKTP